MPRKNAENVENVGQSAKEIKSWSNGFGLLPGSQCRVWNEQRAKWLHGKVVAVAEEAGSFVQPFFLANCTAR